MAAQKEATIDAIWTHFQNHVAQTINGVVANQERGAHNAAFGQDR
jgi:hypothetical protein